LPTSKSPFVLGLQSSAKQNGLHINVGIHEPTTPPSKRIKNTLIWINEKGDIVHRYQKLHLFDVDLRDTGGPLIKESDSTEPGEELVAPYTALAATGLGNVGSLICFDLRFPEPSLHLRRLGSDALVYPSAFTVPTGKAHWETLLRGRAIETQCWIIAAAQCGRHNGKRVSYGDSLVVNPTGEVVGRLDRVADAEKEMLRNDGKQGSRDEDLLVVDIDTNMVTDMRRSMPLWEMRRTDMYPEI
jgi:predicted amidohydrolase